MKSLQWLNKYILASFKGFRSNHAKLSSELNCSWLIKDPRRTKILPTTVQTWSKPRSQTRWSKTILDLSLFGSFQNYLCNPWELFPMILRLPKGFYGAPSIRRLQTSGLTYMVSDQWLIFRLIEMILGVLHMSMVR